VSAKEGWNLNEAFTEMARLAMAREREEMQDFPGSREPFFVF
jgi:hypothetical protein